MPATIQNIYDDLVLNLSKKEIYNIKDDETFYFLLGQACYFIISQSKTKNKSAQLIAPFIDAYKVEKVKSIMMRNFSRFSCYLPFNQYAKINIAIQAINAYQPTIEMKNPKVRDMFYAGLIGENVFYKPNQKSDNTDESADYENIDYETIEQGGMN